MLPFLGRVDAKLRSYGTWVFTAPRQLGPCSFIPYFFTVSTSFFSSSAPSRLVSLKPADITMSAFTPFSPHCSTVGITYWAGIAITASSTSPGTSKMDL